MARLVAMREQRERDWRRWLWLLLLLLFIFALPYATPMLMEPDLATARTLLGDRVQIAAAVLVAGSFVALIKVWAAVIQSSAAMLKPVLFLMQGTAVCILVTSATAWFPGGLGMISAAGRRGLPWMVGLLFLFGGLYGFMRALQLLGASLVQAAITIAMAVAGLAGSAYVVDAAGILRSPDKAAEAQRTLDAIRQHAQADPMPDPNDAEAMKAWEQRQAAQQQRTMEFHNRTTIGDGKSDMEDIEALRRGRRQNAAELDKVQQMVPVGTQ